IGHDVVPAVQRIVAAAGVDVVWDLHYAGAEAVARGQESLPSALLESVRQNRVALKTYLLPVPAQPGVNFNVRLRRTLGMFASVRPLKNLRGLKARFTGVDMLV